MVPTIPVARFRNHSESQVGKNKKNSITTYVIVKLQNIKVSTKKVHEKLRRGRNFFLERLEDYPSAGHLEGWRVFQVRRGIFEGCVQRHGDLEGNGLSHATEWRGFWCSVDCQEMRLER